MDPEFQPPKQDRSRKTLDRLLHATLKVLSEDGLDGATIPRIASAAEVAPASVYRRFKDKDALLRAAFLRLLGQSAEHSQRYFDKATFRERSLEESVGFVIHAVMGQYRTVPRLLLAFKRFSETRSDDDFDRRTSEAFAANLRFLAECLAECSEATSHPSMAKKATFGLLAVTSAIEVRALEPSSLWTVLSERSDEEIEADLVAMLLGYLRS